MSFFRLRQIAALLEMGGEDAAYVRQVVIAPNFSSESSATPSIVSTCFRLRQLQLATVRWRNR